MTGIELPVTKIILWEEQIGSLVFISLLSGLNILILNCTVVSALPLQISLILILSPDSAHGLFIGQVNAGVVLAALFQRDARQH